VGKEEPKTRFSGRTFQGEPEGVIMKENVREGPLGLGPELT